MNMQTPSTGATGSFSRVTAAPPSWFEQNKQLAIRLSAVGAALIFVIIAGSIWAGNQSEKAQAAFSSAMDVYEAPIQQAGQPATPNVKTYPTAAARAKEAFPLFRGIADPYSWFKAGKNALYFAGLTAEDAGNNAEAETDLKKAAGLHNADLAALAKMALASLYEQTGRAPQATSLLQTLIDHPAATVSASAARLALADAEASTNPQGARELYAKVKDSDKNSVAAQIATQKLEGK